MLKLTLKTTRSWRDLFIILMKWISTSDLLFLLFQPNEFPHLIYSFYNSNQRNSFIWFTLFIIPPKWISPSDLLFFYSNQMNFPIWFTHFVIPTKWIPPSDLLFSLFKPKLISLYLNYSFHYSNQMNFPIWFTLFVILTKWIPLSYLLFWWFQSNDLPHMTFLIFPIKFQI